MNKKPDGTYVLPLTLSPISGVFREAKTPSDLQCSAITFEISMVPNGIRVQLTKNSLGELVTIDVPLNFGAKNG